MSQKDRGTVKTKQTKTRLAMQQVFTKKEHMNHSRNPHITRDVIKRQRIIIKAAWLHWTDKGNLMFRKIPAKQDGKLEM